MSPKPKLIIAGPGAGKTHNMVNSIIDKLPELSNARYMVVITYTNAATLNIKNRLAQKIQIPENLFIGTTHSFLNKFIVIPCGSFGEQKVSSEKRFLQCQSRDVFEFFKKENDKTYNSVQEEAIVKSRLKTRLNEIGYITFDQTIDIAKKVMLSKQVAQTISNRIQFLFIDEFQDTDNGILSIVESIRKRKKTEIHCVGDPEQFIRSFDSNIKLFNNIPILKVARMNMYDLEINSNNWRCSQKIIDFLNRLNSRVFGTNTFQQVCMNGEEGETVKFINIFGEAKPIIDHFNTLCEGLGISQNDRCIISKKNDVIRRIESALEGNVQSPKKVGPISPIQVVKDTLLSVAEISQSEFCEKYKCDLIGVRIYCLKIISAIHTGVITDKNTFHQFVTEQLGIALKNNFPIKINNLKSQIGGLNRDELITVCNIHTIKGLESEAVLAIAKKQEELLLWLCLDPATRDLNRSDDDKTDSPRIGYVAFSRAKKLLCIACLETVNEATIELIRSLNLDIVPELEGDRRTATTALF